MPQVLTIHPDTRCTAVTRIEAEIAVPRPRHLMLQYVVTGKIDRLIVPPVAAPVRADGLWQHVCFEAFVQAPPAAPYYEFNFSPSTQWAAYRFAGYRSGMEIASEIDAPTLSVQLGAEHFRLTATLRSDTFSRLTADVPWRLGLSAVIEEAGGQKSYWALAHPPGKPDFHHSDCFAYELRATEYS